jgi:predicted DCC family thiol-disulfide oxidoreductase YuxK
LIENDFLFDEGQRIMDENEAVILILKNLKPSLRWGKPLKVMASVASRKGRSFQALQAL